MNQFSVKMYKFGDFCLDADEKVLRCGDELVEVTPKALEILLVLVENSGRVVSKEEIFQKVWSDSFVEEANLSHHIFRLRKALGETEEKKFIETVPKRGYRFVGKIVEIGKTKAEDSAPKIENGPTHKRILAISALVLLLGTIGFVYWFSSTGSAKTGQIESIAVLPFVNESGNAEVEYLSDGITETLISSLSNLPNLSVKARSSVFRYKGKDISPKTVGQELSVQAILNGRVIQRGDDLTLFLSLIDTQTENQIWGKQYNRKLTSLISLQTDIAQDVSNHLKTKLSGINEQKLTKKYTENPEAYQLYLKGRYQLNRRTEESFKKGIEFFEQAIARDPDYALAYAGLADTYNQMGLWTTLPPGDSFPRAKTAAERALQIDETLAEAHTALAFEKFYFEWDFAGAERAYRQAISLNPNYAYARELYGYHLYVAYPHRFEEAMRELKTAQEIDPLSLPVKFNMAALFYFSRQYDKSLAELKDVQNIDPNFTLGYGLLGAVYREKNLYDESVEAWLKGSSLEGGLLNQEEINSLKDTYKSSGIKAYWRKHAEVFQKVSKQRYVSPVFIAMEYSLAGEKELALEWLEKAYQERSSWLTELAVDPAWDNLRPDPRFQDLLRRVGLTQ